MRKFTALSCVLFACAFNLLAQQSTNKGKIFTTNGELDGFIAISVYEQTPQEFKFSKNPDGPFAPIGPGQIIKVVYDDGLTYEKHKISISILNKGYFDRTRGDYFSTLYTGDGFVEKLLDGSVSFYRLVDKYGFPHFFYRSAEDSDIVYLPNHTYVEDGDIKYDQSYKNLVGYLLQSAGCSSNKGELDLLHYDAASLGRIFRKINRCKGSTTTDFRKQSGAKLSVGVAGGVASDYVQPLTTVEDKWPRAIEPKVGVYFSFSPKHNQKGFAIGMEILTDFYKGTTDSVEEYNYRKGVETYSRTAIHFSPFTKLYLSQSKTPAFAEIGVTFTQLLSSKLKYEYRYLYTTGKGIDQSTGNFRHFYNMAFLGLGVDLGQFSIQARYCTSLSRDNKNNYFGLIGKFRFF